jgi:hypothetical protein
MCGWMHSFQSLSTAIKESHDFGLFVPGGSADVTDRSAALTFVNRVLTAIEELPAYELGVVDISIPGSVRPLDGELSSPHLVFTVHLEIDEPDAEQDQIIIIQRHGSALAFVPLVHYGDEDGWCICPYTVAIDPSDPTRPQVADLEGFEFTIEDREAFEGAVQAQVEIFQTVLETVNTHVI